MLAAPCRQWLAPALIRRGSRNGAPFAELPEPFRRLQQHRVQHPGGDREMVEIVALVLHHVMPEACLRHGAEAVLCAMELVREAGGPPGRMCSTCCTGWSTNAPRTRPRVAPPSGLALAEDPRADVQRHDGLRGLLGERWLN